MTYLKRFLYLAVIAALLISSACYAAKPSESHKPLMLVFGGAIGDTAGSASTEVYKCVMDQITHLDPVTVRAFSPDMPEVVRALAGKNITQKMVETYLEPETELKLAQAVGAAYVLRIQGNAEPDRQKQGGQDVAVGLKTVVNLDLYKLPKKHWTARTSSPIAVSHVNDTDARKMDSAFTASSAAVSEVVIAAFGQQTFMEFSKIVVNVVPDTSAVVAVTVDPATEYSDHLKDAQGYAARNDWPNAVVELRKAINLHPDQSEPRIKLIDAYRHLGMNNEAADECRRLLLLKKDDVATHLLLAGLYGSSGRFQDAETECNTAMALDPKSIDARVCLGDIYWNQSKLDQAETAFKDAASVAPDNPSPLDRLSKLNLARRMYISALDYTLQARLVTAGVKADEPGRLMVIAQLIQDEFTVIAGRLNEAQDDFGQKKMGSDDYRLECEDLAKRTYALERFINAQKFAGSYSKAQPHAALAVSMLAQSGDATVSYLKTGKQSYSDEAALLMSEAKNEIDIFNKGTTRN